MKFLTSTWMVMLLGTLTYLGTTAVLVIKAKDQIVPKAVAAVEGEEETKPEANVRGPSWEFVNPDLDEMVADLKQQKESLELREKQLRELTERLQTERQELIQMTQQVHRIQKDIDQTFLRVRDDEARNLTRLAATYSGMKPDAAVLVMRGLDDMTLLKVLLFMKENTAALILEGIAKKGDADARRISVISERLRLAQMNTGPKTAKTSP